MCNVGERKKRKTRKRKDPPTGMRIGCERGKRKGDIVTARKIEKRGGENEETAAF